MRRPKFLTRDWSVMHVIHTEYAECDNSSPTNFQPVTLTLVRLKHDLRDFFFFFFWSLRQTATAITFKSNLKTHLFSHLWSVLALFCAVFCLSTSLR